MLQSTIYSVPLEEEQFLIRSELNPGMQATHMMESADDNGDGSLSLKEMLGNVYVFYSSSIDEEDEIHDEF